MWKSQKEKSHQDDLRFQTRDGHPINLKNRKSTLHFLKYENSAWSETGLLRDEMLRTSSVMNCEGVGNYFYLNHIISCWMKSEVDRSLLKWTHLNRKCKTQWAKWTKIQQQLLTFSDAEDGKIITCDVTKLHFNLFTEKKKKMPQNNKPVQMVTEMWEHISDLNKERCDVRFHFIMLKCLNISTALNPNPTPTLILIFSYKLSHMNCLEAASRRLC